MVVQIPIHVKEKCKERPCRQLGFGHSKYCQAHSYLKVRMVDHRIITANQDYLIKSDSDVVIVNQASTQPGPQISNNYYIEFVTSLIQRE